MKGTCNLIDIRNLQNTYSYYKIIFFPANIPLTDLAKLQLPSPHGINFQATKIVTPPAPQASNVETTADPMAFPSPASLIDAFDVDE